MDKSVNTSAAHVCAFCETKCLCKNAKCDAYALFCGTHSQNRQAEISPKSDLKKIIFTHSDYSRPNCFRLCRPVSGSNVED